MQVTSETINVKATLYTIIIANVPYYLYEYINDNYHDYVIRTITGNKLNPSSLEYKRVAEAFVDSTPD